MLRNKDINSFWEDKILQMILNFIATMFRSYELTMHNLFFISNFTLKLVRVITYNLIFSYYYVVKEKFLYNSNFIVIVFVCFTLFFTYLINVFAYNVKAYKFLCFCSKMILLFFPALILHD